MEQCYTPMGGDHHCERHGSEHAQYVAVIRLVDRAEHHTFVYSSMRVRNPNMLGYDSCVENPISSFMPTTVSGLVSLDLFMD